MLIHKSSPAEYLQVAAARRGGWWEEIRNVHIRADGQLVFNIYLWAREHQHRTPARPSLPSGTMLKDGVASHIQTCKLCLATFNSAMLFKTGDSMYKHPLLVKAPTYAATIYSEKAESQYFNLVQSGVQLCMCVLIIHKDNWSGLFSRRCIPKSTP